MVLFSTFDGHVFYCRIERLAKSICDDMCKEPLSMLCVLKGGYRFFADLSNKIQLIARHSENSVPLSMEFIRLESYQVECLNVYNIYLNV